MECRGDLLHSRLGLISSSKAYILMQQLLFIIFGPTTRILNALNNYSIFILDKKEEK